MKNTFKLILLLTLFFQSSLVFSQINFTNGGGDKLFSNAANWSTGAVPTAADKIKLDTNGDTIIVDGVYNVKQVLATKVKGAIIGNGGNDTLYINGNSGIGQPIQANGTDARVAFHLPVVLETTVGTQTKAFATNGAGSHIKFFDVFINIKTVFTNNDDRVLDIYCYFTTATCPLLFLIITNCFDFVVLER